MPKNPRSNNNLYQIKRRLKFTSHGVLRWTDCYVSDTRDFPADATIMIGLLYYDPRNQLYFAKITIGHAKQDDREPSEG